MLSGRIPGSRFCGYLANLQKVFWSEGLISPRQRKNLLRLPAVAAVVVLYCYIASHNLPFRPRHYLRYILFMNMVCKCYYPVRISVSMYSLTINVCPSLD